MELTPELIGSLGFPIVACIALAIFVWRIYVKMIDNNKEREDKLYTMVGKTQEQLDNAQETNAKFLAVLEQINKDTDQMKSDIDDIKHTIRQLPKRKNDIVED